MSRGQALMSTSAVARRFSISPKQLRKWAERGHIRGAPQGEVGAGRGNELMWDDAAVESVRKLCRLKGICVP